MFRSSLMAAALIAGTVSASFAQAPSAPPSPPPASNEIAPPPSPPGGPGEMRDRARGDGRHEMRRYGPRDRGPHGPRAQMKGFDLRLGEGVRLRVSCGDETIAECVDAAGPLLDAIAGGSVDDMDN